MTDKKTEALKLALEALMDFNIEGACSYEVMLCKNALAEQPAQQEPVAWLVESKHGNWAPYLEWSEPSYLETQVVTPLYTSPPANANTGKQWVGLDQHDIDVLFLNEDGVRFARYIEAKLKEKNA